MKLNFDFEGYQPPKVTEKQLMAILQQRQLFKQTLLLVLASLLIYACLVLLAFALTPLSFEAGIACVVFLGLSLVNSGVLAVLLAKKISPQHQSLTGYKIALKL